jgi:hypothetical protein
MASFNVSTSLPSPHSHRCKHWSPNSFLKELFLWDPAFSEKGKTCDKAISLFTSHQAFNAPEEVKTSRMTLSDYNLISDPCQFLLTSSSTPCLSRSIATYLGDPTERQSVEVNSHVSGPLSSSSGFPHWNVLSHKYWANAHTLFPVKWDLFLKRSEQMALQWLLLAGRWHCGPEESSLFLQRIWRGERALHRHWASGSGVLNLEHYSVSPEASKSKKGREIPRKRLDSWVNGCSEY